jgi:hypothetical protein
MHFFSLQKLSKEFFVCVLRRWNFTTTKNVKKYLFLNNLYFLKTFKFDVFAGSLSVHSSTQRYFCTPHLKLKPRTNLIKVLGAFLGS